MPEKHAIFSGKKIFPIIQKNAFHWYYLSNIVCMFMYIWNDMTSSWSLNGNAMQVSGKLNI